MRRIGAWFALAFVGVVVPVAIAVTAFAPGVAEAAGCQPAITSVTTHASKYLGSGRVDIAGRCFGTATAFTAADRSFFRISDVGARGALPNGEWNACWTGDPGTDSITCDVTEWSDTHVTFQRFTGTFGLGGYRVAVGDRLVVQVWNAQSGAGPAVAFIQGGAAAGTTGAHNSDLNSIASALASPTEAFRSISSDIVNGTIAVLAVLFITFPANLFNQTFEENYADIRAWWRKRFGWLLRRGDEAEKPSEARKVTPRALAAVVLGGAFLGGLLDPGFGFNLRSVLTVVATSLAICTGVAVPLVVTQTYFRVQRHAAARMRIRALPAGLAIAAACVVISRLSEFRPGYLYGIVAGVALSHAIGKREQAHLIAYTTLAVIGVSVLAWIAWAAINGTAQAPGANAGVVLVDDALASIFVAGLVGSVISMMPLRFLPGHTLRAWNSRVWLAVFGVSMFGLIQILLRPHSTDSGPSHTPLVTTLLLFVLFAVGTVLFRSHFIRKQRRAAGQPELTWQEILVRLAGEARNGPVQATATTDGVGFVDLTEPVVDLTAAEAEPVRIEAEAADAGPAVPAQRAPRKRATPRAGAKSR